MTESHRMDSMSVLSERISVNVVCMLMSFRHKPAESAHVFCIQAMLINRKSHSCIKVTWHMPKCRMIPLCKPYWWWKMMKGTLIICINLTANWWVVSILEWLNTPGLLRDGSITPFCSSPGQLVLEKTASRSSRVKGNCVQSHFSTLEPFCHWCAPMPHTETQREIFYYNYHWHRLSYCGWYSYQYQITLDIHWLVAPWLWQGQTNSDLGSTLRMHTESIIRWWLFWA